MTFFVVYEPDKVFSHRDETVTSVISESLSQMMQNEHQDLILLDFVLDRLPVPEGSEEMFVSKGEMNGFSMTALIRLFVLSHSTHGNCRNVLSCQSNE